MATRRVKHLYLQTLGVIILVLALVRCAVDFCGSEEGVKGSESGVKGSEEGVKGSESGVKETIQSFTAIAEELSSPSLPHHSPMTPPSLPLHSPITPPSLPFPRYRPDGERPHPILGVSSYAEAFPDSNHVQLVAAEQWGVPPVRSRAEAEERMRELVYIGLSPYYSLAKLDSSIPYLVPRAAILLDDIGRAFFDSLQAKGMPIHRMVISSVLRTEKDVAQLRASNHNATQQSCHLYGTTFDINYNRYLTVARGVEVSDAKLKFVLSEVLRDMRRDGRCYIKYEVRQPCFHITVR